MICALPGKNVVGIVLLDTRKRKPKSDLRNTHTEAIIDTSGTHGVGIAALVAKPEARSPARVVGVVYPLGLVADVVTIA